MVERDGGESPRQRSGGATRAFRLGGGDPWYRRARSSLLTLWVALLVAGCGGPIRPEQPIEYGVGAEAGPLAGGELLVMDADLPELRQQLEEAGASWAVETYLGADLDLLEGHFTRAFDAYLEVVGAEPNSLAGVLASRRLTRLDDFIPDFAGRIEAALERAEGHPLNPLSAANLNEIALRAELYRIDRRGGRDTGPFSGASLGLPDAWRWTGPLSPNAVLHLDRPEPYDEDTVLADAYSRGGRPMRTQRLVANTLGVSLDEEPAGTYVFETWLHLDVPSERLVVFEGDVGALVTIDGRGVIARRQTGDYAAQTLFRPVRLQPGWHRLRVRAGDSDRAPEFTLRLVPYRYDRLDQTDQVDQLERSDSTGAAAPADGMRFEERPPEGTTLGAIEVSERPLALRDMLPAAVLEPAGPLEAFALLRLAAAVHDEALADRAIAWFDSRGEGTLSAWVAMVVANYYGSQASRAPADRYNRRLMLTRHALDQAPSAGGVALVLATYLLDDGRQDEALALLREHEARLADEPAYLMALADHFDGRGWSDLAGRYLERVLRLHPEYCHGVELLSDIYARREYHPPLEALPAGFRTCQAGVIYQVDRLLLPAGERAQALAYLEALARRYPNDSYALRRVLDLLVDAGETDRALEWLDRAEGLAITPVERAVYEIDLRLTEGRREAALHTVEQALAEYSPGSYPLRRTAAFLEDRSVMEDLRVDAQAAIAAYRERGYTPGAPAVYALDYGAYRYFPDGSSLFLTHQIFHVRTRDALSTYGEVSIPSDALLLRARTIKADGTILEPDNIPGKEAISLPDLEVDDFVEVEYLQAGRPSWTGGPTVRGLRFYFQVLDAPLAHSEMIIEVPREWGELTLDVRDVPAPEVSEVGDFRRYRFVVTESPQLVSEDFMPDADEILPSVLYAYDYSWEQVKSFYRDRLLQVARSTAEIGAKARELTAGIDDRREQARAIYRFVADEIEETVTGFMTVDAVWTLRLGEGQRLPLLIALLSASGFDADLVFAKTWADDQMESPIPDESAYSSTFVRVSDDGETLCWLDPAVRYGEFDYLPPESQGTQALVMSGAGPLERLTTPSWPVEVRTHRIDMALSLDVDGTVRGEVTEHFPPGWAADIRLYLEGLQDRRELTNGLETGLSSSFRGAIVSGWETTGVDDRDAPVTLSYQFAAPGFAQVADGQLVVDGRIFDRELRGHYGSWPSRRHPLAITSPLDEVLELTVALPEGYAFTEVPEPVELLDGPLAYRWSVDDGGAGAERVVVTRTIHLDVARIAPDAYPDFQRTLLAVERAEPLRLRAEPGEVAVR